MRELPSGTVTFLFTDIEGSTQLLTEHGDEYANLLAEHRRTLRAILGSGHGIEVDTQGDAFFYAFSKASEAVAAAQRAQEAFGDGPVLVRMGLHTGEPQVTEEGYVGLSVHAGARIAAAGHGGQILVSSRTKELADEGLFTDLGEHRLKDLAAPIRLFQVGTAKFPPLRTTSVTNLPRLTTSFIGRERELAEAAERLRTTRLLTVTGSGGAGKTRFAIELARGLLPEFPAGVVWVQLAGLRDWRLVLGAAQQALGTTTDLERYIAEKRMLVLFDNFEHVVEAAPQLPSVLSACSNLHIVVTSRELLCVQGEKELALPPLTQDEGAALFSERTQMAPSPAARELSRRLDGLPLAIELAAARARLFSPDQLMQHLSERLDLLKGGRDADPRHATLRAVFDWSYELLSSPERAVLARLSIFSGGCTFDATEAIAGAEVDSLQSLLDKSLIRRTDDRFWMLETIREYARECLDRGGEADSVAAAHAANYLTVAESANQDQFADAPGAAPAVLFVEAANIRAALDWAEQGGHAELGLRLASAAGMFWNAMAPTEGMRRFRSLLELEADVAPRIRAAALRVYGGIANHAGEDQLAEDLYQQSLAEYRLLGDDLGIAAIVLHLAHNAWYRGDPNSAREMAEEALIAGRRLHNPRLEVQALGLLGDLEFERDAPNRGLELLQESAVAAAADFTWWHARMLLRLSKRSRELGRTNDAGRWGIQCLRIAVSIPDHRRIVQVLDVLAAIAADEGDLELAGRLRGAVETEAAQNPLTAWAMVELPPGAQASPGFARACEEGARLSLDEAITAALGSMG